jgi:restriction system protein
MLESHPSKINIAFLKTLPKFQEWRSTYSTKEKNDVVIEAEQEFSTDQTPQEALDAVYHTLTKEFVRRQTNLNFSLVSVSG